MKVFLFSLVVVAVLQSSATAHEHEGNYHKLHELQYSNIYNCGICKLTFRLIKLLEQLEESNSPERKVTEDRLVWLKKDLPS